MATAARGLDGRLAKKMSVPRRGGPHRRQEDPRGGPLQATGLRAFGAHSRRERRRIRIGPRTNISREPEGWSVVIERRGLAYKDYFGDAVWGGRNHALQAAQNFRDRTLLRIEADTRDRRRVPKGSRSKTGVVGVTLEPYAVDGRWYERYVACWTDPERGPQRRRFSVDHYGKERAFALAVAARKAGLAHRRAYMLARQREEARERLRRAGPMPRPVKDPLSRKGISMARRRPRGVK